MEAIDLGYVLAKISRPSLGSEMAEIFPGQSSVPDDTPDPDEGQ
jgi:hypothetical protein